MKNFRYIVIFLISSSLLFFSCNKKVTEAEKVGQKFYNALMQKRYEEVLPLLDDQLLNKTDFIEMQSIFSALNSQRGFIENYRPSNMKIFRDKNDNLIIKIGYEVYYTTGNFMEYITFIFHKQQERFKILSYDY